MDGKPIKPKAFIFDLNGTMIDDMRYHLDVWYDILTRELGANLSRDEVRSHMFGKNEEVLVRIFGQERFTPQEANRLSRYKEDRYQDLFKPHLRLLPGLDKFLGYAKDAGIRMAIGSAAIPYNIDFVLDNLDIRHYFDAVVSAEDVQKSKPHPETFLRAAMLLHVEPEECVVFEDAPKGVEAAENAGMKAVVVTTMHNPDEFHRYTNVLRFVSDYNDPWLPGSEK